MPDDEEVSPMQEMDSETVFETVKHAIIKAIVFHKDQAFQCNRILKEDENINLLGPMSTLGTQRMAEENELEAEKLQFILDNRCLDLIQQEFGSSFIFVKKEKP